LSKVDIEDSFQMLLKPLSTCLEWASSLPSELTQVFLELSLPMQFLYSMLPIAKTDPNIGVYIELHVIGCASESLKFWERLIEEVYPKLKLPIFVYWSGEVDVNPVELGLRVGRLLAKMRVSPLTLKHPIDAVEELRREW